MIYSGIGINTYRLQTRPAMATVASGVFSPVEKPDNQIQIIPVAVDLQTPKMSVIEQKGKMDAGKRLEDAEVIVDIGQGFQRT